MADTTAEPVEAPEEKKGPSKLVLIGGVVGVLVLVAAAWMLFLKPAPDPAAQAAAEAEAAAAADADGEIVPVATDETFNLAGPDAHFAQMTLSAVLTADALVADVEPKLPLLRDAVVTVLIGTDAAGLRTPEGVEQLRRDLGAAADGIWPDGEVKRILVEGVIVQ